MALAVVPSDSKLSASAVLDYVSSRTAASEMTDEDVALVAKLDGLATKAGGILHVDYRFLSVEEWERIEQLNDLGLLE